MFKKLLIAAMALFVIAHYAPKPQPYVDGDEVALYRAVEIVKPGHFPLNQKNVGSCVAFGHAAAADILLAIDVVNGVASKFESANKESIYGGSRCEAHGKTRNGGGDGSNGWAAVAWMTKKGGILYERKYGDEDLSQYDTARCRRWGAASNGGDYSLNGTLDVEARKNPIAQAVKITTLQELDAALRNGYPVTICSGQGFSRSRDKDGFCRAQGSWAHCMCIVGKRNGGRIGYLILNSWGNYLSGPKYKDQPEGSFYAEPSVVLRILRSNDSWALSGQGGFKKRKLVNWLTQLSEEPPTELVLVVKKEVQRDNLVYWDERRKFWRFDEGGRNYRYVGTAPYGEWKEFYDYQSILQSGARCSGPLCRLRG